MKKILFFVFPVVAVFLLFTVLTYSDTISDDGNESEDSPRISYEFEPGDCLASPDEEYWKIGKILKEGGKGKDREIQVLFADGDEAWVKPAYVKKSITMIKRSDLRIGQSVFYTTTEPSDYHNSSIRFATFYLGKITSIGKLHRDIITVNAHELNWKTQVLSGK